MTLGGGTFEGADNGRQESAQGYKAQSHTAYNGKLVVIVGSTTSAGPITVTVQSDGLVPATATVFATDQTGSGLVALEPVYLRSALGAAVALPATVQAIHADGTSTAMAVEWGALPAGSSSVPGAYRVSGSVAGTSVPAEADVTVYAAAGLETYSTVIARGSIPRLPATVQLVYSDGVDARVPVTWQAVDAARYSQTGLVAITGSVPGTTLAAVASVRVADPSGPRQNLALASGPEHAVADASFSGAPDSLPAGMLDGNTTQGGWSNYYVKDATALLAAFSQADASDWVSVSWPNSQTFDTVEAFFVTGQSRSLPSRIGVSVWDGLTWVPTAHVRVALGAAGKPTTISFDPVATGAVRLDMTSPAPGTDTGFLQIAGLQVIGDPVTYHSVAALESLALGGAPIAGFDQSTFDYQATVGAGALQITAVAAANGSVLVLPPAALPGVATIQVTSEDGSATQTYQIQMSRG